MANINEILQRAASLRDETALNSISPERAGGIMYDTLIALNELWLQQGSALVISKIYASVSAMEADTAPVSDLTGQPLRPGQIVVIASSDSDNGSVYRYNGTTSPSWTSVGKIGNLEPVDSLDSDSTSLPLAAHQGKVLDGKISQLGQQVVYDITANNDGVTFASLSALLSDENLSTFIPSAVRCGGMSIRFVQSSSNKYVQYRYMEIDATTVATFTDVTKWQGVDVAPTAGSKSLVESGGVKKYTDENFARQDINSLSDLDFADDSRNVLMRIKDGHVKTKNFDSANIGNENIRNGAIDDTKLSKVHPSIEEKKGADLSIIDNNGNVLANYHDGIHETKKPSPYTINNSNEDDINIEDSNRNRILSIKGGHIKTKNFDSESVINDVEKIKEIIDVDKKFGIELEAIEIPASISEFPIHRLKLVATKKDNYFCYDNPPILMPQDRGYLYVVQETKKFYYSPNLYNRPEYLFDWKTEIGGVAIDNNPNSYMYIISKDGDVICVPQGKSAKNYGRKNPIVYPHNNYTNPVIVDLTTIGNGYLITGMTTDNNSCVYCYGNFILIAEYQADGYGNGDPLRIWKATAPFTSPSNWKIVCQYEHLNTADATTPEADAGKITHFHTVCYDHFSGRFYANTGDASSLIRVLESTDMGETWTQIEGGHQKWRTLGYIFTKDACYWGTDASGIDHAMYKASRVNGVIDFSTTVELCKLYNYTDNGQRVYCCCQTRNPDGILVLERAEPRWDGKFDVPFYSFDDNKLHFIAELKALSEYIDTTNSRGDGRYGFGNEAQTYYQSIQENGIICGASSYDRSLRLDILNNSVSNMLGVTKIKVVKH